jgi:hypothetical protein
MADEKSNLYRAQYAGSGTFIITKPKRTKTKKRLTRVHSPQKRARRQG